jgi:ribulose-phosphate 3-epimerase
MICADPLHVERELRLLEEGQVDLLHIDVMDGNFVPRIGLGPELVKAIRQATELPIDVHLMLSDPERYIPVFAEAGADIITIHAEASVHLPRLLMLIRRCGARPGVALNPATPLNVLSYVLDEVDLILLMMINPGCVGDKLRPAAMRKIADVHHQLGQMTERVHITIDGNVNLNNAPDMIRSGATVLVCGSSSIFDQDMNVRDSLRAFRRRLGEKPRTLVAR